MLRNRNRRIWQQLDVRWVNAVPLRSPKPHAMVVPGGDGGVRGVSLTAGQDTSQHICHLSAKGQQIRVTHCLMLML